jgi:hypothetical protein
LPTRAEEEPAVVAATEASSVPPPPGPAAATEEEQVGAGVTASQAALETPAEADLSRWDAVVVLDEDPTPPPVSEGRDAAMAPVSEPAVVVSAAGPPPTVELSEPSSAVEVPGPSPTTEVAESSSARGAITLEEVMEMATCRYIDFPGVGVIDLEAPQLPEKVLEVATEWILAEPTIMEPVASVSKALQEYKYAGGFTPTATADAADAAHEVPAASTEPAADASAPPPIGESREASLPQPVEAAETTAAVAGTDASEVVVGEARSLSRLACLPSLSRDSHACRASPKTRMPAEPAAVVQERVSPEATTRAASPEIQEAEETGTSLSQGAAGGEARALELACTSWAATPGLGDDSEDNEEVAERSALERGVNWVCHAFDELILPATSVSSLVWRSCL